MPRVLYRELRFHVIDNCLRDERKFYNIQALTEACNKELMESFGVKVSRRTVQYDLSILRGAPYSIELDSHLLKRGIYRYADTQCTARLINAFSDNTESDDRVVCTLRVAQSIMPMLKNIITMLGSDAEILEPEALRQSVYSHLLSAIRQYDGER